jgi:hypothetical protein
VHLPGDRGDSGPVGDGADRFLADQVVEEAVSARRRERMLRDRLTEAATLVGVLAASLGDRVTVERIDGAGRSATVEAVGSDVVALQSGGRSEWWAVDHIVAVRTATPVPGAGPVPDRPSLMTLLADLVDRDLTVVTTNGREHSGRLVAAGDLVTLSCDDGMHHVDLRAVVAVAARD